MDANPQLEGLPDSEPVWHPSIEFMEHWLNSRSLMPKPWDIHDIHQAPLPCSFKEIHQILDLCTSFQSHFLNLAAASFSLMHLIQQSPQWKGGTLPPEAQQALQELGGQFHPAPTI